MSDAFYATLRFTLTNHRMKNCTERNGVGPTQRAHRWVNACSLLFFLVSRVVQLSHNNLSRPRLLNSKETIHSEQRLVNDVL